ncbi:MAG: NAD(+) synthase [Crocinitomicaceae bacterium]|jgi:NAD+ synthase|nr:NAD(+) synthase [Crocinitomicaceae bacterium]|tara:strand:- start:57615 stop:58406 length:792 start_codon:yes stop_codon:yes gene_type:complete
MQLQNTSDFITNWLKAYNLKAETKGFVIGISGGIDSALTSTLAAQTGAEVLCVSMPIHQEESQLKRANNHIEGLKSRFSNVRSLEVDLSAMYDGFLNTIPQIEKSEQRDLSLANSRARLRMTTLYYFAGIESKLVLGTGNKVEDFGVGFYTKYGDGGVDLSPIADLVKSQVFELADYIGVGEEILTAPPTDGLWGDDRTDEDQLGATYAELEWAMGFPKGQSHQGLSKRQQEVLGIYNRLNTANQHKMKPIPVCEIPEAYLIS